MKQVPLIGGVRVMPMSDDGSNVTNLDDKRPRSMRVCVLTMPPPPPRPDGPFTVTVSDPSGKMFEVVFPDFTGELPADAAVMGTAFAGADQVLCNLLTGAMRVYLGAS